MTDYNHPKAKALTEIIVNNGKIFSFLESSHFDYELCMNNMKNLSQEELVLFIKDFGYQPDLVEEAAKHLNLNQRSLSELSEIIKESVDSKYSRKISDLVVPHIVQLASELKEAELMTLINYLGYNQALCHQLIKRVESLDNIKLVLKGADLQVDEYLMSKFNIANLSIEEIISLDNELKNSWFSDKLESFVKVKLDKYSLDDLLDFLSGNLSYHLNELVAKTAINKLNDHEEDYLLEIFLRFPECIHLSHFLCNKIVETAKFKTDQEKVVMLKKSEYNTSLCLKLLPSISDQGCIFNVIMSQEDPRPAVNCIKLLSDRDHILKVSQKFCSFGNYCQDILREAVKRLIEDNEGLVRILEISKFNDSILDFINEYSSINSKVEAYNELTSNKIIGLTTISSHASSDEYSIT